MPGKTRKLQTHWRPRRWGERLRGELRECRFSARETRTAEIYSNLSVEKKHEFMARLNASKDKRSVADWAYEFQEATTRTQQENDLVEFKWYTRRRP